MSALSLTVVTLAFPDPSTQPISGEDFQQISDSESFAATTNSVRTLSTTNATPGNDLSGLLYTPDLSDNSPCQNEAQFVSKKSTRAKNLPADGNFAFIAIAPWISSDCTVSFLESATTDPIRAFIFYPPNNSTDLPPPANSPVWALNYPGKWQSRFKFPVYAVSGALGSSLIHQTSLYSGNVTNVPNGHLLADEFPPNAYIRLAGLLEISGESNLPSLWVFLLIVLAILMFIIGSTSSIMHCIQRRRRHSLRRRVANGEVDLERLGIRRLTVPRQILDQMPLYVYPPNEDAKDDSEEVDFSSKEIGAAADAEAEISKPEIKLGRTNTTNANPPPHPNPTLALSQTLCAICLDDFEFGESIVRELPCRHIFHPECVDTFLGENSSLCPLCKKTSLPKGYCPPIITNAMVRRERAVRRIRDHALPPSTPRRIHNQSHQVPIRTAAVTHLKDMGRKIMSKSPIPGLLHRTSDASITEMRMTTDTTPLNRSSTPNRISRPPQAHVDSSHRRTASLHRATNSQHISEAERSDMVRQRAIELLGPDRVASEEIESDDEPRKPTWRKAVNKLWPGLG